MSNNHPNRNWRARMRAACDQWLSLWDWRGTMGARLLTDDELRELLRQAYAAGYTDGRKRTTA